MRWNPNVARRAREEFSSFIVLSSFRSSFGNRVGLVRPLGDSQAFSRLAPDARFLSTRNLRVGNPVTSSAIGRAKDVQFFSIGEERKRRNVRLSWLWRLYRWKRANDSFSFLLPCASSEVLQRYNRTCRKLRATR